MYSYIYGKKKYRSRKEKEVAFKKNQEKTGDKAGNVGKKGQQTAQIDLYRSQALSFGNLKVEKY